MYFYQQMIFIKYHQVMFIRHLPYSSILIGAFVIYQPHTYICNIILDLPYEK